MDARTPATHIPGYSRARLKRMIAAGNVAAFTIGFWTIFFPTQLYAVGLSLCVLLPLCALALEMRTRGALGFESRRGRRYPLSIATIIVVPALALVARAISDLNFESCSLLIAAAVLTALAIFALFWGFDPQL
jgi:ABC-type microcin C transport system permease subunit YejB